MRVYQVRWYQGTLLYSSSIKCPATIYLNSMSFVGAGFGGNSMTGLGTMSQMSGMSVGMGAQMMMMSPPAMAMVASHHNGPVFLRVQYSANIYDELISKIVPVLKVEAVSTNSSIHSPLIYSLVNERERFIIDSAQGFIYSRYDLTLDAGVYSIRIEAIETVSGLKSETTAYLYVLRKSKSDSIQCSQDYMILRVDSESKFFIL